MKDQPLEKVPRVDKDHILCAYPMINSLLTH